MKFSKLNETLQKKWLYILAYFYLFSSVAIFLLGNVKYIISIPLTILLLIANVKAIQNAPEMKVSLFKGSKKFIFAFQENKDGSGDPTSSYGVLVIETAADYQETERRINDALDSMRNDSENVTSFISIARASEFMYIVFYKIGGTASYPVVKIKTVASDPNPDTYFFADTDED